MPGAARRTCPSGIIPSVTTARSQPLSPWAISLFSGYAVGVGHPHSGVRRQRGRQVDVVTGA